jgi:geranylgeranylglycerol-phosphate geranylgeranyltransferase
MPGSWTASVLSLVRLRNLLLSAAGVGIGGVLAQGHVTFPAVVLWAMASAVLLGAAGNIANDLADQDADRVNRPERALVSGTVSPSAALLIGGVAGGLGLVSALWVDVRLFAIALAALVVMLVYSPLLKRHGLAGNLAVAAVASLPLVYGATAVGWWRAGLVPSVLAALLHFAREIVKDLADVAGDRAQGRRTIPIAYGPAAAAVIAAAALIAFVPASLAPYFAGWYGRRYGLGVTALDLGVLLLIARLLARHPAGVSAALKTAMLFGLAALLWDRL